MQSNGKNATHTYYAYGEYTATLKITDDDGLSDSTSDKIKVIEMPYPPLNVKVTRVTNRGNSFPHCFCRVEWSKNPKNTGRHNIVKYRIYRKIRTASDNLWQSVASTLETADLQEAEIITLYHGADIRGEEAKSLGKALQDQHPSLQVEVIEGAQPHYSYVISVE